MDRINLILARAGIDNTSARTVRALLQAHGSLPHQIRHTAYLMSERLSAPQWSHWRKIMAHVLVAAETVDREH